MAPKCRDTECLRILHLDFLAAPALPGPQLGQGKGYRMGHHGSGSSSREARHPGEGPMASRVKRVTKRPGQPPGYRRHRKEGVDREDIPDIRRDVLAAQAGRCPLKDKKCPWQILGEILKGSQHVDQSPFSIRCLEGLRSTAEGHIWGGATEGDGTRRRTRLRVAWGGWAPRFGCPWSIGECARLQWCRDHTLHPSL